MGRTQEEIQGFINEIRYYLNSEIENSNNGFAVRADKIRELAAFDKFYHLFLVNYKEV